MQTPYRKPGKYSQMKQDPLITSGKFEQLQKKLEALKKSRPAAAAEVSRLAELGDFSENMEYQLAKGRLRGINNGILMLESQLLNAQIISIATSSDCVDVGSTVTVEINGQEKIFQILGSAETRPGSGIISHTSPLGAALIGAAVGDIVSVKRADGKMVEYVVKAIK